jgi:hypothetical protein
VKNAVFATAAQYGIDVEYSDLGDWGVDELRSEYDPGGPVIRVNKRVIEHLPIEEIGDFIAFSVGHELYHHREHCGDVEKLASRAARESAANDFARKLLA